MCGYIGVISRKTSGEKLVGSEDLKKMTDIIHHRGPDSDGYFDDGKVAFGFRRLSFFDLEHGHQPLSYMDGKYKIVFNGEIYNHV